MKLNKLNGIIISTLLFSGNAFSAAPTPYDNWVIEEGVIYSGKKDDLWLGAPSGSLVPEAVPNGAPIYTAPTTSPSGGFSCDDTNITCKVLVQDTGFIYEEITFNSPVVGGLSKKYLRTIVIDDANLSGTYNPSNVTFSSESFVPFSIAGPASFDQGVAVKQVVRDSQDNFVDISEIQKGMMRLDPSFHFTNLGDPGGAIPILHPNSPATAADDRFTTKLYQSFSNDETGIDSTFEYKNYTQYHSGPVERNPDTNLVIGKDLAIDQTVSLGSNPTPIDPTNDKRQRFVYKRASGEKGTGVTFFSGSHPRGYFHIEPQTTASSMTVERFDNEHDGSTVTWGTDDDISVTWIATTELAEFGENKTIIGNPGEACPSDQPTCTINSSGEPVIPSASGVGFAYQRVNNHSDDTSGSELYLNFINGELPVDLAVPGSFGINPFGWDSNFGTQPQF